MMEITGVHVAFFVGKGNWANALIRWRSGHRASHCEVVRALHYTEGRLIGECQGSSARDMCVRAKAIDLTNGWEIVPVPDVSQDDADTFFAQNNGKKYDFFAWLGATFGLAWLQAGRAYTCSEYVRRVVAPDTPLAVGMYPGTLHTFLTDRYRE